MKAHIDSWKLWGKEQEYPVLIIECTKEEVEATEALRRLDVICSSLRGLGFNRKLAAISNPDTKNWYTKFVIDIGTLLTLCAQVSGDKASKELAVGWLRSLAASHMPHGPVAVNEDLSCKCGQTFKTDKLYRKHKKRCSLLAQDMGLLLRVEASLQKLKKGKAHGKEKKQASKLASKNHERANAHGKKVAGSKGKSKVHKGSDRAKAGRSKRIHRSKNKRKKG